MKLSNSNWAAFADAIASEVGAAPEDFSPPAMERFMEAMKNYIVDVKGIHSQFHALNSVQMITFQSKEEEIEYRTAYDRFLEAKAKIEERADSGNLQGNSGMQILVQFLKFRQAAELIKIKYLCEAMYQSVQKGNQAAVCALNFKASISKAVKILCDAPYNVPRNEISLIWGGGTTKMSKEKKKKIDMKKKIESSEELKALFDEVDIDLYDIGLGQVDSNEKQQETYDESLRLGMQSKDERQKEIDRFQRGKSLYCFFTFKSGGVGLSLHHSDELTKEKADRTKDGWYVKDTIGRVPTRQRICFLSTTYSAMELVQGLGRCPRITSMSDTPQIILFYKNTIEERVAYIVSAKLKCLRKVARNESWENVIIGGVKDNEDKTVVDLKQLEEGKPIKDETADDDSSLDNEEDEE